MQKLERREKVEKTEKTEKRESCKIGHSAVRARYPLRDVPANQKIAIVFG